MTTDCPFCAPKQESIVLESLHGWAVEDGFPISNGHTLVIPKRHVSSWFELEMQAQISLWELVTEVRNQLALELKPDGFNVGVNDGRAAGQTVMHAHVHVIPRWHGDVSDPRGGLRWILPRKARYWVDE